MLPAYNRRIEDDYSGYLAAVRIYLGTIVGCGSI